MAIIDDVLKINQRLARAADRLDFGPPVTHVYNPLRYAREPMERYLRRYGRTRKRALLVGMNPGPFGMAQCGVPFGSVDMVRDWLGIQGRVDAPRHQHPSRPVVGLDCPRTEVSGRRLWGALRDRFGDPEAFFRDHLVLNYCPLCFMEASGRNRTPDKLPRAEREALFAVCDRAFRALVERYRPAWVIGIGRFAEGRVRESCDGLDLRVGTVLHPSPASPAANRGWRQAMERQMHTMGVPGW